MTIRRVVSGTVQKFGLGDRQVEAIVSTEAVDRMGDVIVQRGIDYSAFMRAGGPVLWQHNSNYPVARTIRMGLVNGNLTATAQFPPIGTSEQSDECYRLIEEGVVTSTSIGFIPKKWEFLDREFGDGIRYLEVECLEFSFVSVAAQAEALIIGKSWRGAAMAERSDAELTTRSFSGTYAQRKAQLLEATAPARHARAHQLLDLELAGIDGDTRQGRRRIALAFCRHAELTRQ
jgi:HK97 family phage prohead protease